MLSQLFVFTILLVPATSWAACTSKQVGKVTFVDCAAEGYVFNNPATSGITLQPLSDATVKAAPIGQFRPNGTLSTGGQAGSTTGNDSGNTKAAPVTIQAPTPLPK